MRATNAPIDLIKRLIKKLLFQLTIAEKISLWICSIKRKYPDIFCSTKSSDLRPMLFLPSGTGCTQLNQDIFAVLANRFKKGYFVEIGANDGFNISNTLYLETEFGWNGLLIEANPRYAESLSRRKARKEIVAVTDVEGYFDFKDAGLYGGIKEQLDGVHADKTSDSASIKVYGRPLSSIFHANHVPPVINFVSIDVEGAELTIVEQICRMDSYKFACGTIEHNGRTHDYIKMKALLESAGYEIVWEGATQHDMFFIHREVLKDVWSENNA